MAIDTLLLFTIITLITLFTSFIYSIYKQKYDIAVGIAIMSAAFIVMRFVVNQLS